MAYASQQRLNRQADTIDNSVLLDPSILKAARQIYRTYYEAYSDSERQPTGVVVDRYTHRGKLIFANKPILLPQECFVPIHQIEAELY